MAFLLIGAVSCQKGSQFMESVVKTEAREDNADLNTVDVQIKNDFEVRNNTLHFRDSDAFTRTYKALIKMSHLERIRFAQTMGFKSLLCYYKEFRKEVESATSEKYFNSVLSKYAGIVSLDKTKTITYRVNNQVLASYLDRDGVVYVGKILYKFEDLSQTIVLDGDLKKVDDSPSDNVIRILHTANTVRGARTSVCQYFIDKEYQSLSDRKSRLSVYVLPVATKQGNGKWQYMLTPYAIARPYKKNFWGNWVNYTTDNRLYSHWKCSFYCTEPDQPHGPGNPAISNAGGEPYSNTWDSIEYWEDVVTFSNLDNQYGGSIVTSFEFPTDNGWHQMIGGQNAMSCP